ncbi:MAG TPA: CoA transferase [Ilumatobacteraceae bacterium]|jgi:crotonobetainyl-CoA:carnitine CoA-transferase CaiB-like acyl-CoA transferase
MTQRPLDGIRVLDFTRVLSGPHATRMLCDLGADVIKVEPPDGDLTRMTNPRVNGLATYFIQQNTGKRNISVDTTKREGVELLLRLAAQCDVLIENFRPGVMDRIGLGYEPVAAGNPRIIYASINGYGSTGPWSSRRAYAPVVGAEVGITKAQGDARHGQYANDPFSHADVYTSLETATAILAALFARERTGQGERIEVSMAETMLYVNEHAHDQLWDGDVPPDWVRSFEPETHPVVVAGNGQRVVISGNPAANGTFERFMTAIGQPEAIGDPRFVDVPARRVHFDEILDLLNEWAAGVATPDDIEAAMATQGLATGTLRSAREVCATDWARERGVVVDVPDRGGGTVRLPNSPWRFASTDLSLRGEPRYRGEDNRAVLGDLLGMDERAIDRLESEGVLSSRMPKR